MAGAFSLRLGPRLAGTPSPPGARKGGGSPPYRQPSSGSMPTDLLGKILQFGDTIRDGQRVYGIKLDKYVKLIIPAPRNSCFNFSVKKVSKKPNKEHYLWIRKDSAGSGKKALHLVDTVSKLPNEKEAVYGALDKWTAFEPEFPIIAAAKALEILKRQRQWLTIIQVAKWLMSKGQVLTWTTYDALLMALFMDGRMVEAEMIWNTIIQTHTRSVPKRLFSRMILIYDSRNCPDKVLEIYADMDELGVHPDEDTTRRIGRAFVTLGQEDKEKIVLEKYLKKWKYIHFNGERVRVRRGGPLS